MPILNLSFEPGKTQSKQKVPVGHFLFSARSAGLEPVTPAVTGRCSNQIELRPHSLNRMNNLTDLRVKVNGIMLFGASKIGGLE